jgi:dienelactone hydrolase
MKMCVRKRLITCLAVLRNFLCEEVKMINLKRIIFSVFVSLFVFISCSKSDARINDDDSTVTDDDSQVTVDDEYEIIDETIIEEPDETEVPDETEEPDEELTDEENDEDVDDDPEPEPYDPRVAPALCGINEYTWVESQELGYILQHQKVLNGQTTKILLIAAKTQLKDDVKLKRIPAHDVTVYRVRYQTQDKGKLVDATGFIAVPDTDNIFPVLSVLHGTAGLCDACAPTHDTSIEGPGAVAALIASFGYIVAFPDYIGLKSMGDASPELHSYLIGEPTAIASLDMIRSVPNLLTITGEKAKAGDSIITGGSQGGHAAAFLTRLAPYYAPELNIKGAVWGIPPTDLEAHMQKALNEMISASGNTALFLLSSNEWYTQNPDNYSQVFISPYDEDLYVAASTTCDLGKEIKGIDKLEDFFTQPLLESAATDPFLFGYEPWDCYVKENSMVTTSIPRLDDIPAFMILSENDTLVFPDIERDSFLKLCEQGYQIQFKECAGASHSKGFLWSLDEQMDWLDARMRNEPLTDYCVLHDPVKCDSTP